MLDIIRPGDPRYGAVRHVYTATGSPAAVVRPRTAGEVAEALQLALETGGPLSIRSGGHGISSPSTNDGGTVIDLAELNTVQRFDSDRRLVRVGPGARWGEVAQALSSWGLAISSGDSGDVGVGGLATAGGIGLLGRAHGLTIDHLVSADIVTADGQIRSVDAENDPDLFWAVRGAGANIGIVTSMDFRAAPVPQVAHATFQYRVGDFAGFLRSWGAIVEAAPREISAFLYIGGGGFAMATVVYAGDDTAAAERALRPFAGVAPLLGRRAALAPYADVVARTGEAHHGRQTAYVRNGFAVHIDDGLSVGLAALMDSQTGTMLQIRSIGGAVNDVAADATAFAHRHQNFNVAAAAFARTEAFDRAWDAVRPSLDGLYLSFESAFSLERLTDAFPSETLHRLREIKRKVDPNNVFDQNFPIA